MKQITVKVENQQQLAYLLDILRSKGYKNVQRLNKRYSFPVVVVDLDKKTVFRNKHNMYGCVGVAGENVRHYGGAITCTAIFPRHIVRQSRDASIVGVEVYVSLSQLCSDLCR